MTKDKGYVLNEEENLYECAGCGITITDLRVNIELTPARIMGLGGAESRTNNRNMEEDGPFGTLSNDRYFELSCRHCGGEIGENFLNAPIRHNLREMEL